MGSLTLLTLAMWFVHTLRPVAVPAVVRGGGGGMAMSAMMLTAAATKNRRGEDDEVENLD